MRVGRIGTVTETSFRSINKGYSEIAVELLDPHPQNPNRGDLAVIEESMEINGFYGAVTVRVSPETRGRYQILAGEHRWRTATKKGAEFVPCIVVDADDVEAARIMLVDNESAKRSSYDPHKLTAVLATLGSIDGTGFDLAALEDFEEERRATEPPADDDSDDEFEREFGVIVLVPDENAQKTLYEEMRERGFSVRVASI